MLILKNRVRVNTRVNLRAVLKTLRPIFVQRRFCDSGAVYKHSDLLTYILIYLITYLVVGHLLSRLLALRHQRLPKVTVTDLAESVVGDCDERQRVTDEDDAETFLDVVQQPVESLFDGVGQDELTNVETGAPRDGVFHQHAGVQRPRTRQHGTQ